MTATPAASIAALFVERAEADGVHDLTNLKLQKLVVFVESMSLALTSKKSLLEPIQAWRNGPVVGPLYGLYKKYGNQPIQSVEHSPRSKNETVSDVGELLVDEVWGIASTLTASDLWKITHDVGPWRVHYVEGVDGIVLPSDELGAAWSDYSKLAMQCSYERAEEHATVIGAGNLDDTRWDAYQGAAVKFRVERPLAGVA